MNKKLFDYILLTIGGISIIYFAMLLMNMSFTSFLLIYPAITILTFAYALYELISKKSILKKIPPVFRYLLIILVSFGLIIFCIVETLILTKGQEQYSKKTDYIIVLGTQVNGSTISASLKYRLDAALALHEQQPETMIVVSGGKGPDENNSEAYFMKEYLKQNGVKPSTIMMEDKSKNTNENLVFTKKILDKKSKDYTITIVTNAFHTYRSQMIADNLGLKAHTYAAKMHKISTPNFYFREFFGLCKDWFLAL